MARQAIRRDPGQNKLCPALPCPQVRGSGTAAALPRASRLGSGPLYGVGHNPAPGHPSSPHLFGGLPGGSPRRLCLLARPAGYVSPLNKLITTELTDRLLGLSTLGLPEFGDTFGFHPFSTLGPGLDYFPSSGPGGSLRCRSFRIAPRVPLFPLRAAARTQKEAILY